MISFVDLSSKSLLGDELLLVLLCRFEVALCAFQLARSDIVIGRRLELLDADAVLNVPFLQDLMEGSLRDNLVAVLPIFTQTRRPLRQAACSFRVAAIVRTLLVSLKYAALAGQVFVRQRRNLSGLRHGDRCLVQEQLADVRHRLGLRDDRLYPWLRQLWSVWLEVDRFWRYWSR